MARDPVCGMTVDEKTARFKHEHEGKFYFFCSQKCYSDFLANPAKFS